MSGWGSFGDDTPATSSSSTPGKLKAKARLPPIPVSWEMQRVLDQPDTADNLALLRAQASLSEGNRLRRAGDYFGALMKYERARAAAGELRDGMRAAKMDCAALGSIGIVHLKRGDASKAVDHITRALECARANEDRRGEQRWLGSLGNAHQNMSSYFTAIDLFTQALQINRDIGNKRGEGSQLGNLGVACLGAGDYEAAVGHLTQALRISRAVRDKRGESARLGNLGNAQQQMGNYEEAVSLCLQALDISKAIRDKKGEAAHRSNLGFSYAALEDYDNVVLHHDLALGMVRATGNLPEECSVQRSLADAYDHTGDYPKAVVHYSNALNIQRILGSGGDSNKNAEAVATLEKKLAAAKENKVEWDQQQRERDRLAFLEQSKVRIRWWP
jgi:tetratricopeptide (TPR) repeat protein